jgi:hypothetical protein
VVREVVPKSSSRKVNSRHPEFGDIVPGVFTPVPAKPLQRQVELWRKTQVTGSPVSLRYCETWSIIKVAYRARSDMKKRWVLHISAIMGSAPTMFPTYMVGIHAFHGYTGQGGAFPHVQHPSWQHLSAALTIVGVEAGYLAEFKAELDRKGRYHIQEIDLDEPGVRSLGFTPAQVPATAFA